MRAQSAFLHSVKRWTTDYREGERERESLACFQNRLRGLWCGLSEAKGSVFVAPPVVISNKVTHCAMKNSSSFWGWLLLLKLLAGCKQWPKSSVCWPEKVFSVCLIWDKDAKLYDTVIVYDIVICELENSCTKALAKWPTRKPSNFKQTLLIMAGLSASKGIVWKMVSRSDIFSLFIQALTVPWFLPCLSSFTSMTNEPRYLWLNSSLFVHTHKSSPREKEKTIAPVKVYKTDVKIKIKTKTSE